MATGSPSFDRELAEQLGADQHGMAHYVIAFLKAGPDRDKPKDEAARLQRAHLDNIQRLAEEGKLLLAGPFLGEGELRGIYIFDVQSVEEARALAESDPAIQSGWLVMELRPWYGSAALRKLPEIVPKITENPV
ncbi:MAG: YciI family protein [Gammaproteobacteria bacterium]|nr:YciI family protein [Gammaproteobacteria bacterium]